MFHGCLSVILFTGGSGWKHRMHYGIVLTPLEIPSLPPDIPTPLRTYSPLSGHTHPWPYPLTSDILWSSLETHSNLFTWGLNPPPVMTSCGSHRTDGTHPIGMLSCYYCQQYCCFQGWQKILYRSGTVNSKSFVGKVLLRIEWKFELN